MCAYENKKFILKIKCLQKKSQSRYNYLNNMILGSWQFPQINWLELKQNTKEYPAGGKNVEGIITFLWADRGLAVVKS